MKQTRWICYLLFSPVGSKQNLPEKNCKSPSFSLNITLNEFFQIYLSNTQESSRYPFFKPFDISLSNSNKQFALKDYRAYLLSTRLYLFLTCLSIFIKKVTTPIFSIHFFLLSDSIQSFLITTIWYLYLYTLWTLAFQILVLHSHTTSFLIPPHQELDWVTHKLFHLLLAEFCKVNSSVFHLKYIPSNLWYLNILLFWIYHWIESNTYFLILLSIYCGWDHLELFKVYAETDNSCCNFCLFLN